MASWTQAAGATLKAGGHALEYRCWGPTPEQAPTLVLLHEGLGSVALWRDLPQKLVDATGFGVLAYSRAGYGRSEPATLPRPLDYMTQEALVLGLILDAVGVSQAVLLGHSDGATIAAIYGGSVSDMRVRGLILMAPHFFAETSGIDAIRAVGDTYRTGALRERLAPYHADVDVTFNGWHDVWTDPGFIANWNVADNIDHWRIPVLAIQGLGDEFGTFAQISEIEDRIYSPLEIVLLESCGHSPHLDQPAQTLDAITAFTARLDRLEREEVRFG